MTIVAIFAGCCFVILTASLAMRLLSYLVGFLWERFGVQYLYICDVTVATLRLIPSLVAYMLLIPCYKLGSILVALGQKAGVFRMNLLGYKARNKGLHMDDKTLDQLR